MLYVLIFVGVVALSFYFGWNAHCCYTFYKLSEVAKAGIEDLRAASIDECNALLPFYRGYAYALKLAGVKLGVSLDET